MLNAKKIENALLENWTGDQEEFFDVMDGTEACSFEDAGILTNDAGFIIMTADGQEYQVSIVRSK